MADETVQKLDKSGTETLIALLTSDTRTEAAEKLGITRSSLYARIEKYEIDKHLEAVPAQALGVLRQGSLKAAENFVKKVAHSNPNVSMEASKEVLDRVGVVSQKSNNPTNVQVNVSALLEEDRKKYKL